MRNKSVIICLACLSLFACGPRDIGTGTSSEISYNGAPSGGRGLDVDDLRFSLTGSNNIQQRLYHYNRPAVMLQMQEWQKRQLQRPGGSAAAAPVDPASPSYREVPKQKSPFRQ